MLIEQNNERTKLNNINFKQQNSVLNNNIFNMLSIEESIDQFLIQNTIEVEEDQMIVENMENMELMNKEGLETTVQENQFVTNLDKTVKRKSFSRSSSAILRSSKNKNVKLEGEELL